MPLGVTLIAAQVVQMIYFPSQPAASGDDELAGLRAAAEAHLTQEVVHAAAAVGLLWLALGQTRPRSSGLFSTKISYEWVITTAATCALLFPLVDPMLYSAWSEALHRFGTLITAASGDIGGGLVSTDAGLQPVTIIGMQSLPSAGDALSSPSGSMPYKDTLMACVQNGAFLSLALHFSATCLVGPFWEEMFWRGFLLPSIASRLPGQLPAAVLASSSTFACLHLNLAAGLPIFVLSCACDALYLRCDCPLRYDWLSSLLKSCRSGSLAPPLMLHAAWNAFQFLGVAFFGKEAFV